MVYWKISDRPLGFGMGKPIALTDFLLCAVAHRRGYSIFTTDKDFENFRSHIPVILL
jgi:predicted nucleic acid-binding protein